MSIPFLLKPTNMKDSITAQRVALLHPKFRQTAQFFIEDVEKALNIVLRVSQGLRTMSEQAALYAQGRNGDPRPVVTYSPPGSSYHNYGLAIDVVVLNADGSIDWKFDYKKIIPFYPKYGMTWGGTWAGKQLDIDHYENRYGHNWRDLLHMYNEKQFITGTEYVNI